MIRDLVLWVVLAVLVGATGATLGFLYVITLTGYLGEPITRQRKPTRVRRSLWHRYWELA